MRVLIGLGNPGAEYEKTRHNAGFWLVDAIAEELGIETWTEFKGGIKAEVHRNDEKIILFKPLTFMNRSGVPVRDFLNFYKVDMNHVAIAMDDVYLQPGTARMRPSGAAGGHNGLKSVVDLVDPDTFWRIKIGVGLYGQRAEEKAHQPALDKYVLAQIPASDYKKTQKLIDKITPTLISWLEHGTSLSTETIHI